MEKLLIKGGNVLKGSLHISGAKNAVLPILAATLLTDKQVTLTNLPNLHDVTTTLDLLGCIGSNLTITAAMGVKVVNNHITKFRAPTELVRAMRASILVLGPLVGRYGRGEVAMPGGCAIGARPVNLHIDGLRALGVHIELTDNAIVGRVDGRVRGGSYRFETISVTGTENLIMAAVLAESETILENCACEPEVVDLVHCLRKMGAKISGEGSHTIRIEGVESLNGCEYHIMPDRIETGTYLAAVAITGGEVVLHGTNAFSLANVIAKLVDAGCEIETLPDSIRIRADHERPTPVSLVTEPYPGFPTDMQAQFIAMNSIAGGESSIVETVFDNRFMHVRELQRMGADIRLDHNTAHIRGVDKLTGASVKATDLRASASLVLAALGAKGVSTIEQIHHIDRGYETIEEKFLCIGASIARLPN